jgi:hypothetical protein
LWLYPEPEQRLSFVVCFGYIQSLNKEWVLLFVLYNNNKQQKSLFVQTLDITTTNNKTTLRSDSGYNQNKQLFVVVISRA